MAPPASRARRPRSIPRSPARVRDEVERVTGFQSRISGGKLEIHFGTEVRLEELAEVLESL